MKKLISIILIAFIMSAFWPDLVYSAESTTRKNLSVNGLERMINSNFKATEVFFDLDELAKSKILRLFYKGGDLLKSDKYPLNLKAEIYVYRDGADKKVLAIFNKTIKSDTSTKNVILKSQLKFIEDGDRLFVDLYDSNNKLYGTYYYEAVDLIEQNITEVSADSVLNTVSSLDCKADSSDPECWIEFFLKNVNFVASYDKNLITEVVRTPEGGYNVLLPIKKGRRLKKKVGKFNVDGGTGSGNQNGDNFFTNLEQGYYPFFNTVKDTVAAIQYKEGEGITFNVNEGDTSFAILDTGVIKLAETTLDPTPPEDGVLEFDGDNIYYTAGGVRQLLSLNPSQFADLSNGGVNYEPIHFVGNGKLQAPVFNGALTFMDGTTPGHILVSGVNGLATWQDPVSILANGSLSSLNLDNATITNSSFLNGSLSNTSINNSNFTNGSVSNTNIVDSNLLNGFLQDPTINGRALFTTNSTAIFNGQVIISGGNPGEVLSSGVNGVASWQSLSSFVSNGTFSNVTLQNSFVNNSSVTNSSVDSSTINNSSFANGTVNNSNVTNSNIDNSSFTNGTVSNTTITDSNLLNGFLQDPTINGRALFTANSNLVVNGNLTIRGGSNNFVLTSDANGIATWQALPSSSDNLGNHIAGQNLNLNGFSLINAQDVNGVNATFTGSVNAANFNGGSFNGSFFGDGSGLYGIDVSNNNGSSNNLVVNNGYLQDPTINGLAFFTNNSTAQFNGAITIPTGANIGYVLGSDALGNATWVNPATLSGNGDNLGNHTATQALAMAGFSVTNAGQVNGTTANFTTGAITTVNSTTVNTANQNLTGFALFDTGSSVQVNGTLTIPAAAAAGRVLTSDATGNATWQIAPSGADHMGNHVARQALDMNGFTLFNADQVNGTTANFTNVNVASGLAFFNGGTTAQFNGAINIPTGANLGYVLGSDAAGNAAWVNPATLSGNGDNLGNHTATQALAMAGFSVTNAGQVNGTTANFTTGAITTVNSTTVNTANQNLTGFALFDTGSSVQVNGTLTIPAAAAAGRVLTSDATGNATWQPAGSGADHMGNHVARQALDMNGFTLFNADQVNGTTANFTNINVASGLAFFNGGTTAQFNGAINIPTGANIGYVLGSDALGNAAWVNPATLSGNGDNLGNHTATQALAMAGFSVTNAGQVNGTTANFTTGAITTVNSTTVNTANQNLTGFALFDTGSSVQVNGTLTIPAAAAAGRVLTSDATGNATWQIAPSGADHMGNHVARQALDMNGFTLFNADQVNGVTANFTNVNVASGLAYFNGGTTTQFNGAILIPTGAANGFVLASDANGLASWVSAASLSGTGDNLGNHTATQALAMAGFSVTNAGQVNGTTANFTTAVNTLNSNTTGFALFDTGSSIQVNGTLTIPAAAAAGRVLTSDATGNATWQPAGSGADHMGNHVARQALDMNGFTLFNADQVNGVTANFTNVNVASGLAFFNGGTTAQFNGAITIPTGANIGYVLGSDAAGNATWVNPATLSGNGDNLGNHTATQALAMAGFSVTNAGQVNGTTANFTTGAITTVNSTTVNTANQNLTGFALFDTGSSVQINGDLTITPGATNGFVLSSDANGVAIWENLATLIANNPNINTGEFTENPTFGFIYPSDYSGDQTLILGSQNIATADIVLGKNGDAIFNEQSNNVNFRIEGNNDPNLVFVDGNSDRVGIGTLAPEALFEVGNGTSTQLIDPDNGVMIGGELEVESTIYANLVDANDLDVSGNAFYGNTSSVQFNGAILIPAGAANGYVLASDANGLASWVSAASLSGAGDNLGNHTATQALGMAGFSVTNADQVNGATANFTNTNTSTIRVSTGANLGYVLRSDGAGNGTWVDPVTIASNGDNLGNHTATQALAMAGFSVTNAGQVNGATANFNNATISTQLTIPTGAAVDRVLRSDGTGNASWVNLATLPGNGDNLGNHTATQALAMAGFSVTNAGQVNGTTANFTTGAITTVNSTTINTANQNLTGFALFDTGSSVQVNGTLTIPAAAAAGRVLTSDATGNATWQIAPSGADHMGNHVARQALDMNGFTLFNADQVNGTTANFTNVNVASGLAFFNGGTTAQFNGAILIPTGAANGYVLASDANGLASWVSAASLSGAGDNLGNHTATQALGMAGFSVTNADQVNGATANFTNTNTSTIRVSTGATLGHVLRSDGAGNGTWVDPATIASNGDNLGNHTATQALGMAGFSVTNADQVNGVTANFTNTNTSTIRVSTGATLGHVLRSDGAGNGTWVDPATIASNGDNLGSHTATQALGMAGFSITNAGQVNGTTANFNNATISTQLTIPTGAAVDRVLRSDGTGNASWVNLATLPGNGDNLGNHTATQALAMAGFSVTNAGQVNGTTANFTTAVNTLNSNTTGFALFDTGSSVQVNGTLTIPALAAAGRVLTSDATGNASWQPAGSGADHMGNHVARQALDMNGFTLFNADQVNGTTANFTNINVASGLAFFNGGTTAQFNGAITIPIGANIGYVLGSDAAGNAAWVNPATLSGNGDNLGNHTATQALAMAGFSVTNAGQVNGTTANFTNTNTSTIRVSTGATLGHVLRSDGAGNGTWVDPATIASNGDNLGNHTATQALAMAGFSVTNAGQVNGTTANFADLNATGRVNANLIVNDAMHTNASGVAVTLDWNNGNKQVITMAHNITFTFTAPSSGGVGSFTIILRQDATGSRLATWPAAVLWPSGVAPTLSTTANAVDIVSCLYDGTNYYCQLGADFR